MKPHRMQVRGMAALTVVMMLFFVMALVAGYTNRNLIFEQRISANNYRSTKALEAADAGVEWAVGMLNGGRVSTSCQASNVAQDEDFRRRYMADAPEDSLNGPGGYGVPWGVNLAGRMFPSCINRDGVLTCICPSATARAPEISAPADGVGSAFAVSFLLPGNDVRPGAIQIATRGCASPGQGATACFSQSSDTPQVDSVFNVLVTLGLVRALPIAPPAALTAGTVVDASAGRLLISNPDRQTGMAVNAGGGLIPGMGGTDRFEGPSGWDQSDRARLVRTNDLTLANLAAAPNNAWFRSNLGSDPATFRRQPATILVNCNAGCTWENLANIVASYPRNPIYVNGNLNIDAGGNLGSVQDPLMLVVDGTLTVASDATITGFLHANAVVWTAAATVRGAVMSASTFTTSATTTIVYDAAALTTISLRYGSFVRVPGSWNSVPNTVF
jgi:hypothetical protein